METLLLLFGIAAVWFWLDSITAREIAVSVGKQTAQKYGLQFLDDTVAVTRLRAARDLNGRMRFQRTYSFEVSDTGAERLACSVTLLGKRVDAVHVPPHRDFIMY